MTILGAFRDDYYNAISVLPQSQSSSISSNGGTISATAIGGAGDCYIGFSGQTTAQAFTTDTAVNIIAQIQQAVAAAYKAAINSFGAAVNPPVGVPNLFNMNWTLTLNNFNASAGTITLTGGTGVTLVGTNAATIAFGTQRVYIVTVTSPTTVTLTSLSGGAVTAP